MRHKGYTGRYIELVGCTRCGAVVGDPSLHDTWHFELSLALEPDVGEL